METARSVGDDMINEPVDSTDHHDIEGIISFAVNKNVRVSSGRQSPWLFLEGKMTPINSVDDVGNTPLTFAIKKHHEIPVVDIDTYC